MGRTQHFHCRGPVSIPGQGTKIPCKLRGMAKKKKPHFQPCTGLIIGKFWKLSIHEDFYFHKKKISLSRVWFIQNHLMRSVRNKKMVRTLKVLSLFFDFFVLQKKYIYIAKIQKLQQDIIGKPKSHISALLSRNDTGPTAALISFKRVVENRTGENS